MNNQPIHPHSVILTAATAIGTLLLCSCANQLRPPLAPNTAYVNALKKKYEPVGPPQPKSKAFSETIHEDAAEPEGRNKIINELLYLVNDYYDRYELRWYATSAGVEAGADITTLGLDLGSAVAGTNSLKTILSTISAGIGGSKLALERDILQNQNMALIVRTMRESRKAKYEVIRIKMALPVNDYPIEEALIDIQEYWHAGTVIGAVQKLHNQTSSDAALKSEIERQQERVNQIKTLQESLKKEEDLKETLDPSAPKKSSGATTERTSSGKATAEGDAETATTETSSNLHERRKALVQRIGASQAAGLSDAQVERLVQKYDDTVSFDLISEKAPRVQLQLIVRHSDAATLDRLEKDFQVSAP
jgi:cell division septum initiation protein DivIVA